MEDTRNNIKNKKFFIWLILGGILFLILFSIIEYFMFQLLNFVFYYKFIAIFVCFIIHYMLARYLVLSALFPGSNFLVKKFFVKENGKAHARQFLKMITTLKNNLKILHTKNLIKLKGDGIKTIRYNLRQTYDALKYYIKIYHDLRVKYRRLSLNQTKFNERLSSFKEKIEESEIIYNINEAFEKIKNYEDDFDYLKSEAMDIHLDKLVSHMDNLESIITEYLLGKSFTKNIKNFWTNDIFGSVRQLRAEMNLHFNIEEHSVQTKDKRHNIEM